jgi:hypothetical protein
MHIPMSLATVTSSLPRRLNTVTSDSRDDDRMKCIVGYILDPLRVVGRDVVFVLVTTDLLERSRNRQRYCKWNINGSRSP